MRFLILVLASSTLACTKATPEFGLLDASVPQPKFSGSTTKNISTSSDSDSFSVTGECDSKIKSISALVTGESTVWVPLNDISVSPATVLCSSAGTFAFQLKSLSSLGFTITSGRIYEVQLRATSSVGHSASSYIKIFYSSPVGLPHLLLSAGGVHGGGDEASRLSSSNFKMEVRMSVFQSQDLSSTSANFAVKVGSPGRY